MFIQRVRVRFEKRGELKAISHLDLMRAFERALRRTDLPLRMSEGYNPRPRISFPVPLGVGIEGLDEVMEFDLDQWVFPAEIEQRIREELPAGLSIKSVEPSNPHAAAQGKEVSYEIRPKDRIRNDVRLTADGLKDFATRDEIPVSRIRKGKRKVVDIRPFLLAVERDGDAVVLHIAAGPKGSARPEELLGAMGFDDAACRCDFRIVRTRVQLAN